jgi:hypothetical protein
MQAGFSKSSPVHGRPRLAAQVGSLPRISPCWPTPQPAWRSRHEQASQPSHLPVVVSAAATGLSIPLDASGGSGPSVSSSASHHSPASSGSRSSHVISSPGQQQAGQSEPDLTKLKPLPTGEAGRLRLPPTAPITWTFMITYLLFMLVVPIVALLVRQRAACCVARAAYQQAFTGPNCVLGISPA